MAKEELAPAGDWFDGWLEHGTVAQRSVDVYGRPDLFAKYEVLARKLEVASAVDAGGEKSLGESSTLTDELEALYKEWQESKTTWFIRALNSDEFEAMKDAVGYPDDLAEDASDAEKDAYAKAYRVAEDEANAQLISKAFVRVENPAGDTVATEMTPERVKQIRAKLGDTQILRLVQAAMVALSEDSTIPVPLSRTNSKNAQSS